MIHIHLRRTLQIAAVTSSSFVAAACSTVDLPGPPVATDTIVLTGARLTSLDSTARVIGQTNATNPELKSLVDSTLLVFTAGIEAKRVDVSTNLTTAPLYFIGIHRAVSTATSSYSTWTLVGLDDPSSPTSITSIVEVAGFAQNTTSTPPASVSATIGDGGFVNAQLLHVAAGGVVNQFRANTGSASFTSSASGAACPGFTPTAVVTCTLETMRVHFTVNSANGAVLTSASLPVDVDIPTMRLNYNR